MPIVMKSVSLKLLENSGSIHACNGIALPLPLTSELEVSTHDLQRPYDVQLPPKITYDHRRRRYMLSDVKVRIAEHANMSALNVASLILLAAFPSCHTVLILYRMLH
jgi:hypothetical protein